MIKNKQTTITKNTFKILNLRSYFYSLVRATRTMEMRGVSAPLTIMPSPSTPLGTARREVT